MLSDEECREIWRTALARCHPTNDISVAGVFAARAAYALGVEQTTAALSKPASEDAREGFVSVPVEQAKDGELFRSLKWRFEEDRDMGPGGRWWVSVSTNDPKIRNDLRKVLIEAAKGDTNADV